MKTLFAMFGLGLCLTLSAAVNAQESAQERLEAARREQQAILGKAERLRELMINLRKRYILEERKQYVERLTKGIDYLKESGLMETVTSVRDLLDAKALTQANQKAEKVVSDLESLLQILLDRPSMEKIEEEIKKTRELELDAGKLAQQQAQLLEENRATSRQSASKTERELAQQLRNLARMQEEEAQQNMREAGTRQPFLEDALQRLQNLLRAQSALEKAVERQRTDPNAADPNQHQAFELGALRSETTQQLSDQVQQRGLERVAEDAKRLQEAARRKDDAEVADAKDALRNQVARATEKQDAALAKQLQDLLARLDAAEDAAAAEQAAKDIEKAANDGAQAQRAKNNKALQKLQRDAKAATEKFEQDRKASKQQPGDVEADLKKAAEALEKAEQASKDANGTQKTMSWMSQALRKLSEARAGLQRRSPDPETRAGEMASKANEVARDLRESPGADPAADRPKPDKAGDPSKSDPSKSEPTKDDAARPAENRAAQKLDQAERDLRDAAEQLRRDRKTDDNSKPRRDPQAEQALDRELQQSRQNLEQAKQAIEEELKKIGSPQQAREQAAQRQQQLTEEAQRVRDQMQQASKSGELSPQQQKAADQAMQRAQQQMQQAQKSLQQNRQSQAAQQQQQAADSVDNAMEQLEKNRPLDEQQKQQLKEQAKRQKTLAEDIMKLAKLAEERKNKQAQQALDQAGEAAQQAAEELDRGNDDQAEQKQEEARQKLEEAKKALEEERERYEDLRQEELLFKIQDELRQFLAKQEPITQKTEAAGKQLSDKGRLSRRARRGLKQLGDEEQELADKAKFMREALEKEAVLVFSHALQSSEQDLAEVQRRLAGRTPNPDEVTVVLQKDVEERTRQLIEALKREQKRRQQQKRNEQQQQQQQDQEQDRQGNNQNQRRRLVSITAELEMLKQMEQDMMKRTTFMEKLIETRGENVAELDLALLERLAHRHSRITEIFLELKKQIEQVLNPPQPDGDAAGEAKPPEKGK